MRKAKRVVKTKDPPKTTVPDKRGSQWEALMRKFSEDHKEECSCIEDDNPEVVDKFPGGIPHNLKDCLKLRNSKAVSVDIPRADRDKKEFPTGSMYQGSWDVLGMSGYGVYTFANGVIYEGDFEDGMFHGDGELRYPSGIIVRGLWKKGTLDDRSMIFADGVRYSENNWDYCKMPDRRFSVEFDLGQQPAGNAFLTADQPTRDIPPGHYDTGDGFFNVKTKVIYNPTDLSAIIRSPTKLEQQWILDNCRSNIDEPLGARSDLYEEWPDPAVNSAALARTMDASIASSFACGWRNSFEEDEGGWRRFSISGQSVRPPRQMSATSYRSADELFGARQQTKFRWGDIAVVDP